MKLNAARAASKTESLSQAFAVVGSVIPRGTARKDVLLHEYWVASMVRSWAEPRYRRALAGLIEGGLINDPERRPWPVGTNQVIASGAMIEVRVTVAEPQERVDMPAFLAELDRLGVKPALIKRALGKCTTEARAAHVFKPSLVTG